MSPVRERLRALALPAWQGLPGAPSDPWTFAGLSLGLASLWLPTVWRLARWVWVSDEQGHGPIILGLSAWLIWRRWPSLPAVETSSSIGPILLSGLSLAGYVIGRSQAILMLEVGSLLLLLPTLLWWLRGWASVKALAFPLAFMVFMIPWPEALVAAVTAPLKSAVSWVASGFLQELGYPVGRAGVLITAGPYQLLVADACAGLNSLFTLEALGLLYMHLMGHAAVWRNAALAVLLVPISFGANVLRVATLVLVTLHFGDAAGRGYAHGFAGITLFAVALALMLVADALLGLLQRAAIKLRSADGS